MELTGLIMSLPGRQKHAPLLPLLLGPFVSVCRLDFKHYQGSLVSLFSREVMAVGYFFHVLGLGQSENSSDHLHRIATHLCAAIINLIYGQVVRCLGQLHNGHSRFCRAQHGNPKLIELSN